MAFGGLMWIFSSSISAVIEALQWRANFGANSLLTAAYFGLLSLCSFPIKSHVEPSFRL